MIGESPQNPQQPMPNDAGTAGNGEDSGSIPVVANRAQSLYAGENATCGDNRRLTPAEKRVMKILCDPQYHASTNRERHEAARVGESRYYEIIADPWFKQQEKELMLAHMHGELAPIVKACIDTAKRPGRDGHADRRLAMEVTGLYEPRKQIEHTHTIKPVGVIVGIAVAEL